MKTPKTLGVVVEKIGTDPPAFRAGVVWGTIPWVAGVERGATPAEAVAALEGRMHRLGHEPAMMIFDTLEEAHKEGRRRLSAEDVLRALEPARARLAEVLAGEDARPDARDRYTLADLDGVIRAVRAVYGGLHDEEASPGVPPIQDGRIVCPRCGPDCPDAYFTATADALTTAYLSPTGVLTTWKDVYVSEEGYREILCGSCDTALGDLTLDDLQVLDHLPEPAEESQPRV